MARHKVTCIVTKNDDDTITKIGSDKLRWTTKQAIEEIKDKTSSFYTKIDDDTANVIVKGTPPNEYLATDSDTSTKNNLLSLPRCS